MGHLRYNRHLALCTWRAILPKYTQVDVCHTISARTTWLNHAYEASHRSNRFRVYKVKSRAMHVRIGPANHTVGPACPVTYAGDRIGILRDLPNSRLACDPGELHSASGHLLRR